MKYYSTNNSSNRVSIEEALLLGQAPDKGLFMPESIPRIDKKTLVSFRDMSYPEVAFTVMRLFLEGVVLDSELKQMAERAYSFAVPIEHIHRNRYILRLDQGPTASFKDFAARMLARLMEHLVRNDEKELVILVATSGDTGGAVADAFYDRENIKVIVLFPDSEISKIQRKQMTTLGGNITALAVNGTFDDCQGMVRRAFADPALKHIRLSSANSINFGRMIPQIVYYFYAYSRIAKQDEEIVFSVPSGNMGNMVAGVFAKKMGLPVKTVIAAFNANDEFTTFLRTGTYTPIAPPKRCLSTAMNIGNPSNLARLFALYGGHLDETGAIRKLPDLNKMKTEVSAVTITDEETVKTLKTMFKRHSVILEPHGAVGWAGLERNNSALPGISLETAHPAKFLEEMHLLGIVPDEHPAIMYVINKKEINTTKITMYKELFEIILSV
jgi:threonine synthase